MNESRRYATDKAVEMTVALLSRLDPSYALEEGRADVLSFLSDAREAVLTGLDPDPDGEIDF